MCGRRCWNRRSRRASTASRRSSAPGAQSDRPLADELVLLSWLGPWREYVVEEAVVLVVGDAQGRVLPQDPVARQRVQYCPRVVRTVARAGRRVLGVLARRDDPGDLGKGSRGAGSARDRSGCAKTVVPSEYLRACWSEKPRTPRKVP
jgi:hypothetical protein